MSRASCLAVLVVPFALAAGSAAPVPKADPPRVKAATLRAALGKTHLGKEIRDVTRGLGECPVIRLSRLDYQTADKDDGKEDDAFALTWKAHGVEMAFERGVLKAIFVYSKGADGFDRYPGELPGGVSFADGPDQVERKLGKAGRREEFPEVRKVGGEPQDELWLQYPAQGVWIILRRLPGDPYAIHTVHLYEPERD
jgi:hypothetical protein